MAHKYVLDTHPLVWYLEANPRLTIDVKIIIDDPDNELVLPLIALAEAAFIVERGRASIPNVTGLLRVVQADPRILIYPATWEIFQQSLIAGAKGIPEMHDRLIVATALHLQGLGHTVSLLTKDSVIAQTPLVPVVW